MDDDELDFEPRLGRSKAGAGSGRKYLHRILAAANLARGGKATGGVGSRFTGSRIGRGAGVGRVLSRRDSFAAFRQRRVLIKSRLVRLAGKGFAGAAAHLRYIQRDGTTRDGERGELYAATSDRAHGRGFLERCASDPHQFRFIVSAEDGAEYEDLKPLTRRLMARMEEDLGTSLDWVAVDHFNTGHPHTHIMLRGKDSQGRDLVIARDYIAHGMRERAAELVNLDLGPRSDREIETQLRAEVAAERLTSIDRQMIREKDAEGSVTDSGRNAFEQTVRMGRLRKLERLGLARPGGAGRWALAPDLGGTLQRMGERHDIIRTIQRSLTERGRGTSPSELAIHDLSEPKGEPLIGRLLERGLSDEHADRRYLLIEGVDGRTHYVDIGKQVDEAAPGSIVRVSPSPVAIRQADRTVLEVAAANGGRYDVDAHLRHDRNATEDFAQTHVRRLEAIRRLTGGVDRRPDGSWDIASDHLERALAFEAARARDHPFIVERLASAPLEHLVAADAPTWLDHELMTADPRPLREAGFGEEVRTARERRRQWLLARELAEEKEGRTIYRPDLIEVLRRRELLRIGASLSRELGLDFAESKSGDRIEGVLRRSVEAMNGRYALIERSRDFTLVPWRPVLERHVGRSVSGILRRESVSWTIGRERGGPAIS